MILFVIIFITISLLSSKALAERKIISPLEIYAIQYCYWKWGTHARVFSRALAHGSSKMEIKIKGKGGRIQAEMSENLK